MILVEMENMVVLNLYPYYGHAPPVRWAVVLLMHVVLDYGPLLVGLLCRVGCRRLHVHQNSRQP
jgi:hypothetical protein